MAMPTVKLGLIVLFTPNLNDDGSVAAPTLPGIIINNIDGLGTVDLCAFGPDKSHIQHGISYSDFNTPGTWSPAP
jgi:hypothetical protein